MVTLHLSGIKYFLRDILTTLVQTNQGGAQLEDKKKLDLASLASIPLVMTLGNSMLIPVLPMAQRELEISKFQSSLIITVYSVVAIIFIPVAGYLSDRIGRKKIIIPSLFISGIGGLISGLCAWFIPHSYWLILLGRFLQGIGASGAFPVAIPTVGDMFKNQDDVSSGLGVLETSNTFGKVLSPILGAFLASFIWYIPLLAIPVLSFGSLLLVAFFVKPPKGEKKEVVTVKKFLSNIKKIFKQKWKWISSVFLIGGIIMLILFGTLFYLSDLLEEKNHINGIKKGFVLAIPLFSLSLCSFITGKKIGENKALMKWLTFGGMVILMAMMIVLSFNPSLYFFIGSLFIAGIGIGLTLPSLDAFITEGIEEENRGTFTCLYSSMRFIGVAFGPPLFAFLMTYPIRLMFWLSALLALLAIIVTLFFIRPNQVNTK